GKGKSFLSLKRAPAERKHGLHQSNFLLSSTPLCRKRVFNGERWHWCCQVWDLASGKLPHCVGVISIWSTTPSILPNHRSVAGSARAVRMPVLCAWCRCCLTLSKHCEN